MEGSILYSVLQISDSGFPTGGFSHSLGAEAAIQCSYVQNESELQIFTLSSLENLGSSSVPFMKAAYEATNDLEKLSYFDSLQNAYLLNHIAHRSSQQQGKSLLSTSSKVFKDPKIYQLKDLVAEQILHGHFAIVFGVVGSCLDIPVWSLGQLFMFISLRTILASFVRLGKIGAIKAQQVQFEMQKNLDSLLSKNWELKPEDTFITHPINEVIQNIHDSMFSKMFFS